METILNILGQDFDATEGAIEKLYYEAVGNLEG